MPIKETFSQENEAAITNQGLVLLLARIIANNPKSGSSKDLWAARKVIAGQQGIKPFSVIEGGKKDKTTTTPSEGPVII